MPALISQDYSDTPGLITLSANMESVFVNTHALAFTYANAQGVSFTNVSSVTASVVTDMMPQPIPLYSLNNSHIPAQVVDEDEMPPLIPLDSLSNTQTRTPTQGTDFDAVD
jgi:broad specificity polyphosphatase/5'/3'-nucleotidase SurE